MYLVCMHAGLLARVQSCSNCQQEASRTHPSRGGAAVVLELCSVFCWAACSHCLQAHCAAASMATMIAWRRGCRASSTPSPTTAPVSCV